MSQISPSILGVDFTNLKNVVKKIEDSGADMLHVDVMDGIFVPNVSFSLSEVEVIYNLTSLPLDVHLMIDSPHKYVEDFAKFSSYLGIHFESNSNTAETLLKIKKCGSKTCLVIKPKTSAEEIFSLLPLCDMVLVMSVEPGFGGQKFMPSAIDKLMALKKYIIDNNLNVLLEVDGGIDAETGKQAVISGADVLVVGSYLFNGDNLAEKVDYFKNL